MVDYQERHFKIEFIFQFFFFKNWFILYIYFFWI